MPLRAEEIERVTLEYEERLEPLREEIAQLKEAYKNELSETLDRRAPKSLGGQGSVRRSKRQSDQPFAACRTANVERSVVCPLVC